MNRVVSWLAAALLATVLVPAQAQTVRYIHTDALGTPVAETDANRVVIERNEYEPYGSQLSGPSNDGPGYTGHVQDVATGLTYMQQRYYDPQIGRFLSVDPVTANSANGSNFNRYWYANNNPYKFKDPDGRFAILAAPLVPPALVALGKAAAYTGAVIGGLYLGDKVSDHILKSESNEPGATNKGGAPPLPEVLVGEKPDVRSSGKSATSGPMKPEHGGTGDYDADLATRAGETRPAVPGDPAPPGAEIGANGVYGREKNSSGGRSIDIPANGSKPHETLHYPPREN